MVSRALLWGVRARRLPAIRAPGWRGLHRATQSQSSVAPLATPNPAVKSWGYFTDVEGNLEFFKAASGISRVVSFNEASNALELKEGCGLVFGGDCFDKGPGDIRISRALVDLKKRHPDRVFLLLGNRDVNKMKLSSELHPTDVYDRQPFEIAPPFWIRHPMPYNTFLWEHKLPVSTESRILYMSMWTMGAANLVEFRRMELAAISGREHEEVSGEEVAESFLSAAIEPDGFYREYLAHAQIAVTIGDTLFVHGGVTEKSIGFVPHPGTLCTLEDDGGRYLLETHSAQEWITELNQYGRQSIAEWMESPLWCNKRERRGGEALMAYCHGKAIQSRSCTVADFTDQSSGNLVFPNSNVSHYLAESGINRVVTGHKPCGDCPGVMRSSNVPGQGPAFEVITADTSFSDASAPDSRGAAVNALTVVLGEDDSQAHVSGVRATGVEYAYTLPAIHATQAGDPFVGTMVDGGWWVRTPADETCTTYILGQGEGYKMHYREVPKEELAQHVQAAMSGAPHSGPSSPM